MSYAMEDGTFVNPSKAQDEWEEGQYFDGHNMISCATGSQWEHEHLYKSTKGRYYIVSSSQYQGVQNTARYITASEAAAWLLQNRWDILKFPDDLAELAEKATE